MIRSVIACLAATVLLTACQSDSYSKKGAANPATVSDGSGSPIPAMPRTRFSDVPLPEGIKEDMERSYVYESSALQVGRMVYKVDQPVTNVAQFYLAEAPRYGWQLTNMLQAEGVQMGFEKASRRMWVNVTGVGAMKKKSSLIINILPDESATANRVDTLGGRP